MGFSPFRHPYWQLGSLLSVDSHQRGLDTDNFMGRRLYGTLEKLNVKGGKVCRVDSNVNVGVKGALGSSEAPLLGRSSF